MNDKATVFRSAPVSITLGDTEYILKFDLNALCHLETIYESVNDILSMLFGGDDLPDFQKIEYAGAPCRVEDITIDNIPLQVYLEKASKKRTVGAADTRNILYAGCMHAFTTYDDNGDVVECSLTKNEISKHITLGRLAEANAKIISAIIRDLRPGSEKKAETPQVVPEAEESPMTDGTGQ